MRCHCPDDCGCRAPWRTNYCGCRQHAAQLAIAPDASIVAEPVRAPEEQHESMRLFTPAPTQLEGQLSL